VLDGSESSGAIDHGPESDLKMGPTPPPIRSATNRPECPRLSNVGNGASASTGARRGEVHGTPDESSAAIRREPAGYLRVATRVGWLKMERPVW